MNFTYILKKFYSSSMIENNHKVSIQISNFIYYLPTCNVSIVKREVFFKSFLVIKWGAIITQSLSIKKTLIMHPIAHLVRQNMGCNLQSLIYIMLQSTQGCMKYLVILDSVIMALNCTMSSCINIPKFLLCKEEKKCTNIIVHSWLYMKPFPKNTNNKLSQSIFHWQHIASA